MIKLVCSDMDGTLVGSNHKISLQNAQAILDLEKAKIEFLVVTGRSYEDTISQLKDAGIKCRSLVMNGAELRDIDGKILQKNYLSKAGVKQVIDKLNERGLYSELYTNKGNFTTCDVPLRKHSFAVRACHFFPEMKYQEAYENAENNPIYQNVTFVENIEAFLNDDVVVGKIICFDNNVELLKELRESLPLELGLEISGSFPINLEITNTGANKGLAIKKYAMENQISIAEIVTIGDGLNDLSMMDCNFGATVAMENGIEELKQKAKFVTTSNDNDGVAYVLETIIGRGIFQ